MNRNELRHRVSFEKREKADDGAGGTVDGAFVVQFTVAAAIVPKLGGEVVSAERLAGRQPVVIRIRCSSTTEAITPAWRARDARTQEIYNIRSISNPDMRRQYLELMAESGAATES